MLLDSRASSRDYGSNEPLLNAGIHDSVHPRSGASSEADTRFSSPAVRPVTSPFTKSEYLIHSAVSSSSSPLDINLQSFHSPFLPISEHEAFLSHD